MAGLGKLRVCVGALFGLLWAGQSAGADLMSQIWDIRKAPTADEWRWFRHAPPNSRSQIWGQTKRAGFTFAEWAWQWRIGWVQVCASDPLPECREILWQGLADKALLIRSEASAAVGARYAGTGNIEAVRRLGDSFQHRGNVRHNQPLIAYRTALFALRRIGGKESREVGERLAARFVESATYWKKIGG